MTAALAQPYPWAWEPQVGPQANAVGTRDWCTELFYGGAVFGGKSDFLLGDFLMDLDQGPHWRGILFRQTRPELEDLIERSLEIYPKTGGVWTSGNSTWRWPQGCWLRMRYMENANDFQRYLGHAYSWIGFDELPNWPDLKPYRRISSRLRGPAKFKRIRATGNPGGRCHNEIKERFYIGQHRKGYVPIHNKAANTYRMFIPSRLEDNKIGIAQDPGYEARLSDIGDPELVKAWREGDWDAVVGAYFSMYSRRSSEIEPFNIPEGWELFGGLDYGESNPTWFGIVAVDSDDRVFVVSEYYAPNTGGRDHARGIKELIETCPFLSEEQQLSLILAPADMWTERKPGEASQAMAPKDSFEAEGLHLTRANMNRINGWRNLKDLLYGRRLFFFRGRTERIQGSLASVQRDDKNPEDVLKGGDDHPADGLRYIINHVYRAQAPQEPVVVQPNSGEALLQWLEQQGQNRKTRYE